MNQTHLSLLKFGFRLTIKGAVIFGLLAAFMTGIQGYAFAESYPTPESQRDFAASLQKAPALGVLYGESDDLTSPAGYVVYRTSIFLALVGGFWGISTATKLIRGQEEDGRIEIIAANRVSRPTTQFLLLLGFFGALIITTLLTFIGNVAINMQPIVGMTLAESLSLSFAIALSPLLFGSLGFLTSQLSATRRRAFFYATVPLAVAFGLRALGNTTSDFYDLKYWSPFGWIDLLNIPSSLDVTWFILFSVATIGLVVIGQVLSARRDFDEGIIAESFRSKSKFFLLRTPTLLSLRLTFPSLIAWLAGVVAISSLMAALSNIAVDALSQSPALTAVIAKFGGTNDLTLAFLGSGTAFIIVTLLVMIATHIARIRRDESTGFLDMQFSQPQRRVSWLLRQTSFAAVSSLAILLVSTLTTWLVATSQNISVNLVDLLLLSLAQSGVIIFCLGVGIFCYSLIPRLAATLIYALIAWSFIVDMLQSIITIDDWIIRTSLFHHLPLSLSEQPDWRVFTILIMIAMSLIFIGSLLFKRRDIIAE